MNTAQLCIVVLTTFAVLALLVNEIWGWEIRDHLENRRHAKADRMPKRQIARELDERRRP